MVDGNPNMREVKRCKNCDCYTTAAEYLVHDGYCPECYEFLIDDKLDPKEEVE